MLITGRRVFSGSNRVVCRLEPLGKLVETYAIVWILPLAIWWELILFAFLRVVGIRLGLTFELRQRVHAVSELTSKEWDYYLLVTDVSLIDSGLSQVSSSNFLPLPIVRLSSHIASLTEVIAMSLWYVSSLMQSMWAQLLQAQSWRELAYCELTHGKHELVYYKLILVFCWHLVPALFSLQAWIPSIGPRLRGGGRVLAKVLVLLLLGEVARPKQGHDDWPQSPVIWVSLGSSGQRR